MKFIIKLLSWFINLIPKSENILVFNSFPDFTDNAYAVYLHLKRNKGDRYRLIWIFNDKKNISRYPDIIAYYKFSLSGFYYFARAKYVFSTHGLYSFISLNHNDKLVNLWHGMPLKNIGSMDLQHNGYSPTKADYLIATSPFFQKLMSKSFNDLPLEKVLLTGQPRTDMLFEPTEFYANHGIERQKFNSIGLWLPTYRQSIVGDIRVDGSYNDNGISFLSMHELTSLNSELAKNNSLLIVKLHPMDALQNKEFEKFDHLIILKSSELKEQLYPLIGSTDYLLTDYSSVWIDYCIMKKPIGFVMNDIDEYKKSRGLTIDDLDEKLPGVIIDTYEKLTSFIFNLPEFNSKHLDLFNTYCDKNSSTRLVSQLGL